MYVLIFVFIMSQKATSGSVEFNTLAACQAAAKEMTTQARRNSYGGPTIVFCAAKGGA